MNVFFLFLPLLTFNVNVQTAQVGIIRNVSLVLIPIIVNNTINQTTCQNCLCQMLMTAKDLPFFSFNCYDTNVNRVICEFFTSLNYINASFYKIQNNESSVFYFLKLPSVKGMLFPNIEVKLFFFYKKNSYHNFRKYILVI